MTLVNASFGQIPARQIKDNTMKKTLMAVALTVALSGCGGVSPEEAVARGDKALSGNDIRAASIEYKSALKEDPSLVSARVGLAKIALLSRDYSGAVAELEKAYASDPKASNVRSLLARAYHNAESFVPLVDMDGAGEPEIVYYQILASLSQGDESKAESLLSGIGNGTPFGRLAHYIMDSKGKSVKDVYAEFPSVDVNGDAVLENEVLLLKSRVALQAGMMDEALDSMGLYYTKNPEDFQRALQYAHLLTQNAEYDKAKPVVNALIKRFPKHGLINELKAVSAYEDGDYETAQSAAILAAVNNQNSVIARLVGAYSAVKLGDEKEALKNLDFIIDELGSDHPAQRLYIRLKASDGNVSELVEKTMGLTDLQPEDAALLSSVGLEAARRGDVKAASALADKAAEVNNADPMLGMLQLTLDQKEKGFATLESALIADPASTMAANSLASAYLAAGKNKEALALAEEWINGEKKMEGLMLKGVVLARQGNSDAALSQFDSVLKAAPEHFMARAGKIEVLVASGRKTQATEFLKVWIQQDNMLGLYRNYLSSLRASEGQAGVDYAARNLTSWIDSGLIAGGPANLMAAQSLFMSSSIDDAEKYMSSLESEMSGRPDYWLLKASIAEQKNDFEVALASYQRWQEADPSDPMPLLGETRTYANAGDYRSAINALSAGLSRFDNAVPGQVMLAQLYLKTADFNGYKRTVNRLPAKFLNDSPLGKAMSGVVSIMSGDYKKGIALIEPFVDKTGNEDFLRWLISGLESTKQGARIEQVLNAQFSLRPDSGLVNFMLGNHHAAAGSLRLAKKHYGIAMKSSESNPMLLNNLGWVELQLGNKEGALALTEKAVEIAPDSASFVETYANALIANGRSKEAVEIMESLIGRGVSVNEVFGETLRRAKNG